MTKTRPIVFEKGLQGYQGDNKAKFRFRSDSSTLAAATRRDLFISIQHIRALEDKDASISSTVLKSTRGLRMDHGG